MPVPELRAALESGLPPRRLGQLRQVQRLAAEAGLRVYLAGGFVRDLLLGRAPADFDFVVEPGSLTGARSAATALARALAEAAGGEVTVHAAFGTATCRLADGTSIDFSLTRTETYAHPGALPAVTPALDIRADLARRDFTLNAMAVRVDGDQLGELIDPYQGQADLERRQLRVLHPNSFRDDPTRIFRGARYEQRLGFLLSEQALSLVPAALPVVPAVSGERVRHELELIFREMGQSAALGRLASLGVLEAVHPALHWSAGQAARARVIPDLPSPDWRLARRLNLDALYLALLLDAAAPPEAQAALGRLSVTREVDEAVRGALAWQPGGTRPSEVVARLDRLSEAAVVAVYVLHPAAHPELDRYLSHWRFVRAETTGDDLVALGLKPGPEFKRILWRLREARLDGEVVDQAGELALVRQLAGTP